MPKQTSYHAEQDAKNLLHIAELQSQLPSFIKSFVNSLSTNTTTQTRKAYLYDLRVFFAWMKEAVPDLKNKDLTQITIDDLSHLTTRDLEEYIVALQTKRESPNSRITISRKLAALATMFRYLYRHDDIPSDPCAKLVRPKVPKDKRIVYLDDEECRMLLSCILNGTEAMTPKQKAYLANTRIRDFAIATVLLNTGIRVSECAGLNITDFEGRQKRLQIRRKGGKFEYVKCNTETVEALNWYLREREKVVVSVDQDRDAFFLSMRRKRIDTEAIERMIKKYARYAGIQKTITPHKLRKTFGTSLYKETGDIYLVANALGHDNVATTTTHYVDANEDSMTDVIERLHFGSQMIEDKQGR